MFLELAAKLNAEYPVEDQLSVKQTVSLLVGGLISCALVSTAISVTLRLAGFGYRP